MANLNDRRWLSQLVAQAEAAGHASAQACQPVPMVVGHAKSVLGGGIDYRKPMYHVADGVCGFAWVNVKPGNSALARYLKSQGKARKDSYYGGVSVWVSAYGQSMERKEAYARAYAEVLRNAGFKAYSNSRMD